MRERGLVARSLVLGLLGLLACGIDRSGLSTVDPRSKDASVIPPPGTDSAVSATGTGGTGGVLGSGGILGSAGGGGADMTGAGGSGTGGTASSGSGGSAGISGAGGAGAGTGGTSATGGEGLGGSGAAGSGGRGGAMGVGGVGGGNSVCSPATCPNGCCDQDRCVTQRSTVLCGSAGGACKACGGCQLCAATGTCVIDPESRWTIVCDSAELVTTLSGGSWDGSGELGNRNPDPFCQFETVARVVSGNGAGVTGTVMDSFTARWNETVSPPGVTISGATLLSPTARWRLWVGDDDGCNGNQCVGDWACEVDAPMQATWLQSGGFTVMNVDSCVSLSVQLVCQP